jgi:uncharacterized membrane protein YfcA
LENDFSITQWLVLGACSILVGISKTGVPGAGILNVPLIAMVFPAKMSTGLLLPLLAFADIPAVLYYRRHAKWGHVFRLLPWALCGIAAGSFVIRGIDERHLKPLIGIIVLAMLAIHYLRRRRTDPEAPVSHGWWFAALMGFTAGLTTQLANAAGPIMVIYLLSMRLPKEEFLGTGAWYFLILNWLKIPVFVSEGRITVDSVQSDLVMIPLILCGAFLGIWLLKRIPQEKFNAIVQILAVLTAMNLVLSLVIHR